MTRILYACGAALAIASCAPRTVSLGGAEADADRPILIDAGADSTTAPPTSDPMRYGCIALSDPQLDTLRKPTCPSVCSSGISGYSPQTQSEIVASTFGRWLTCGQLSFGPTDVVGIEFAPGCRLFLLRRDVDDRLVRGTEAAYQANFDMYDPSSGPARIDIHVDASTTLTYELRVSVCPATTLKLLSGDQAFDLVAPSTTDAPPVPR